MTLLIVLGVAAVYLWIGARYARSQSVQLFRRSMAEWSGSESIARSNVRGSMAWRVLAWPWGVVFDQLRGPVARWFDAPIDTRRARAAQLRADAAAWREKQRTGTPAERQMAAELAAMCDERAKELDL